MSVIQPARPLAGAVSAKDLHVRGVYDNGSLLAQDMNIVPTDDWESNKGIMKVEGKG
jgi:hypothetical protein